MTGEPLDVSLLWLSPPQHPLFLSTGTLLSEVDQQPANPSHLNPELLKAGQIFLPFSSTQIPPKRSCILLCRSRFVCGLSPALPEARKGKSAGVLGVVFNMGSPCPSARNMLSVPLHHHIVALVLPAASHLPWLSPE